MYKRISLETKSAAVARVQKGETKASVARDLKVPESTLRGWCKSEKIKAEARNLLDRSMEEREEDCNSVTSLAASHGDIRGVREVDYSTFYWTRYLESTINNYNLYQDLIISQYLKLYLENNSAQNIVSPPQMSVEISTANEHRGLDPTVKEESVDGDNKLKEALEHGKKFIQWLETCGHPCVSETDVGQIRELMNDLQGK
ncbi:uncharacterized protein [Leptinotarsa decemlineata]|uniref:uncharacterized protein n=1 Tax=Leptinotarsa decemlineata TaxID=7539 RepID=UPI003D304813